MEVGIVEFRGRDRKEEGIVWMVVGWGVGDWNGLMDRDGCLSGLCRGGVASVAERDRIFNVMIRNGEKCVGSRGGERYICFFKCSFSFFCTTGSEFGDEDVWRDRCAE